ncbi:Uncharacterised protein [Yersinia mollaretii]|uniref:hypothetical protein n=1 Tax=Yersinia mollaretii TaxID=33060 RepID=UPI0005E99CE2|nr:hypothetical protein [Yersinia mollaretii]CNK69164.1 Uncharacterised protein [Yersinia mollaretii]
MDITKSQSDFEAWVVTWWPQSKTMIAEKFDDGGYWNMPLQQYFEAWKASRESLVVELPELIGDSENSISEYFEGLNDGIKQCGTTIIKAGIRIKGESE